MKTLKYILFFFAFIVFGEVMSVPCEAASLFHKEDFEDNNKMDTFAADSQDRLSCLLNSSWIVHNSCVSYGTTVTPVKGNYFLAGNWKSGALDECCGNSASCNNNRLRLLNVPVVGGTRLDYKSNINSEFLVRFCVRTTGSMPITGYNANVSKEVSTFKLMYMYPGNTCIQIHPSGLENNGRWDVYSTTTPTVYSYDPRPPLRDADWHKIEIYVKIGSSGHVTLWCDDIVRWDRNINVSIPNDIGLMYNDGTKGFMEWDAPWFFDELEFYVDTGDDFENSKLRDGTIGEGGDVPSAPPSFGELLSM